MITWGMVHKSSLCTVWKLCSVKIAQCARSMAEDVTQGGVSCLRMHCCDSYHWPKAPREIYDERRIAHNTKQTGRKLQLVPYLIFVTGTKGKYVRCKIFHIERKKMHILAFQMYFSGVFHYWHRKAVLIQQPHTEISIQPNPIHLLAPQSSRAVKH